MSGRISTLVVLSLALALGVTAGLACFSTAGSGTATAGVGALGAPTISGVTAGAGTVALSWSTVSPPPPGGTVTYYVSRNGGNPGGNCPTSASPTAVTACTDSGLDAGTYSYTVTAVWRSWKTASSSTPVTLVSGALDHFSLAAATTTPTAGAADNLTVTAKDSAGHTVTAYGGDQTLTFGGAGTIGANQPTVTSKTGTAVAFGTAETIAFTSGVAAVSGSSNGVMTLYRAENATVTVSDGTHTGSVSVTVGFSAANRLAFTQQPGSSTGGIAFGTQPKVTVQDAYGNTVATDSSSVTLAITGGTGTAGAILTCTTNPQVALSGVATFAGCKIDKAGTGYALAATDGSLTSAASSSFNITVGAAARLGFVQQPAGAAAATAFATQPKVAVQDAGGNTVTSDTSSVTLAITTGTGTSGAALTCTSNPLAATSGVAGFAGCKIDKAGIGYTLTATDGTLASSASSSFTVSLALGPTALPGADVGTAYNQTFTASGGTSPYAFSVSSGSLPSGLTLSSAGVLSGTPAAGTVGTYTFTVNATDAATGTHNSGSRSYTLYVYDATIAATKSATGTSATTSSFTLNANTTYVVFAYAKSGSVSAAVSSTFGGSPAITQLGSQQDYNNNAEHAWTWYLTGGASNTTGTITVSFGAVSTTQAYIDVVALAGNNTSAPVVTSNEGFHTITGTTKTNTAVCDLPSAPSTGNFELAWFSSGENVSTPTSSNAAITSVTGSHQAGGGGTVDLYSGAAQQTESLSIGPNRTWGTISLEINHP